MAEQIRVLLLEDDRVDAEWVQRTMARTRASGEVDWTFTLEIVDRLERGLEVLQGAPVDILLADLGLPDAEGIEIVDRLVAVAPGVPLVVLTGREDERLMHQALRRGAQEYVVKGRTEGRVFARLLWASIERHRMHANFRRWLADTVDGVVILDRAGNVLYANPAAERLVERPLVEWRGSPFGFPMPGKEATEVRIASKHDVEMRADETEWEGQPCFLVTMRDISERKRILGMLHQAQRMEAVGRLAGGVAHDFNNLLTVISGYTDLLLMRLPPTDAMRKDLGEIRRAAESAAALTGQLLAFSRRQVLEPRVLELNSVVQGVDKMLRRLIGEDIELVTLPGADLGRIRADPHQMEQVLMNLAVNARDAMPKGGSLTIETRNVEIPPQAVGDGAEVVPGPYVLVAVSDTGCGMSEEVLAHIFEPFYTTKAQGKGTGLGLATVYGIVQQSGGMVRVHSTVGVGSTFEVCLPRVEAPLSAPPQRPAVVPSATRAETILLVEDAERLRYLARRVLETNGYRVLEAGNGEEAMRIATSTKDAIHLILLDCVMPVMGGAEVARRFTRLRPGVPILFMSGYTDQDLQAIGVPHSFLAKPFTPSALAAKVREVLAAFPAAPVPEARSS